MKKQAFAVAALVFGLVGSGACGDDAGNDMALAQDLSVYRPDFASSPFAGIHCGEMSCPDAQVCCVRPQGLSFAESCETAMACMSGGAAVVCDGPEDCAGESGPRACCATVAFQRTGPDTAVPKSGDSACVTTCAATVNATMDVIEFKSKLCHLNSDCAGFMGDIYGTSVPFDGCCYRPEIDLRFCAPSDQSYRNIGGYYCL